MRPDDVPSWKESTKRAWRAARWILPIVPMAYVMALVLPSIFFLEPTTPEQARLIKEMSTFHQIALPGMAMFLWMVIFLNWISAERSAKTPKEIETIERRMLAALLEKYPDVIASLREQ